MFVICLLGLDAFQAEKVMETLRQLAEDGHTIICSIHQPRGSVYGKFDDVVLLSEGEIVYMGPAKEEPLTYFASLGLLCYTLLSLFLDVFLSMHYHDFCLS
jgi:ABC-type multidrug transport system ATPase subunit